jgi:hypothetical protein
MGFPVPLIVPAFCCPFLHHAVTQGSAIILHTLPLCFERVS